MDAQNVLLALQINQIYCIYAQSLEADMDYPALRDESHDCLFIKTDQSVALMALQVSITFKVSKILDSPLAP